MRIAVNPRLPKCFDSKPNDARPASHQHWWFRPFIRTFSWEQWNSQDEERKAQWFAAWPSGTRYSVRCLDGGAWDRTTNHGSFPTLEEAKRVAGDLAELYKDRRGVCPQGYEP